MNKYTVTLMEILGRDIEIEAENAEEAYKIADRNTDNGDIVLTGERDFYDFKIIVHGSNYALDYAPIIKGSEKDIRDIIENNIIDFSKPIQRGNVWKTKNSNDEEE